MRFHIRPQNGVDAGLVAFALGFEPREYVTIRDFYRTPYSVA